MVTFKVNEVIDVMRTNVTKVMERDTKLSDLDQRSQALEQTAVSFSTTSKKLKKK
jgi:vesicle-associated membrane protein 2